MDGLPGGLCASDDGLGGLDEHRAEFDGVFQEVRFVGPFEDCPDALDFGTDFGCAPFDEGFAQPGEFGWGELGDRPVASPEFDKSGAGPIVNFPVSG